MKNNWGFFNSILALAVFWMVSWPQAGMAGEKEITRALKGTIDEVVKILKDEKLKQDLETRRELLRKTINKRFSYDQMAVRALAKNWEPRTPEEKEEFTRRFRNLLERSYAQKIESFTEGEINFSGVVIKGKYSKVKTRVSANGKSYDLDYKLIKEKGVWKVYDFVVGGVSIIRNYRHQFARTLQKESFSDLLKKMEAAEEPSI